MQSGQQSLWPYDFSIIPIETISAIYEHFLKAAGKKEKKASWAFFTPRFLAELVLDITLDGLPTLLDKRFLDPACGSGIFLVGLFNRMAEEWRRLHPSASYLQQVKGLLKILHENIFGVDSNKTACRITAFSLYLAFLDQLLSRDIRELQRKGKVLPRLVYTPGEAIPEDPGGTIRCADFFTVQAELPEVDFVIGNPPWAGVPQTAPATSWCAERNRPFPRPSDRNRVYLEGYGPRIKKAGKSLSFSHTVRYSTIVRWLSIFNKSGSGSTPSNLSSIWSTISDSSLRIRRLLL